MQISRYLAQKATWEKRSSEPQNSWGMDVYEKPTQISVRRVKDVRNSRIKAELKDLVYTEYITEAPISVGDKLDGEEIRYAAELRDKRGVLLGTRSSPSPHVPLGSGA